ncbi:MULTISPECIES: carbohydrate ABC transporter permease [unclassified Streptomyces]|uniref:carbohydrate ABC transporter permease n=1 Tax=unclassified Streptomyces TaxID=2593676 RepID=UPI0022509402|nr:MULTISPECIES: carbohydrate ABC transporter permease [unclassified Streptomyces]MCX4404644.1 carbohydrate ABC transporter permease [Streptomyces sp. NBC_01764]MCX5190812.1 carbohydrate ABC transporter permease [Streptomyces sp. NBC_00268]
MAAEPTSLPRAPRSLASAPPTPPQPVSAPAPRTRRTPAVLRQAAAWRVPVLLVCASVMVIPMWLLMVNAFKTEQDIRASPFGLPLTRLTLEPLRNALTDPDFDVLRAYGITLLFVVLVNALSLAVSAPVSFVIARGTTRWHTALLLLFVAGTFVPSQVLLIPVVYVLKYLGLMGTITGFVLFETALTLPVSVFLYSAYIRTIPKELDQAAAVDGIGRLRTFQLIILPLMRPIVATAVILHSLSVWNDFANPQIILGPGSGLYTVTTGVYAAVGKYSTNYAVVFPNLLLAVAPALAFFAIMQRHIISGLTTGALKG